MQKMSDANDKDDLLLNYDEDDDDKFLDEDELLLSDEEVTPSKLTSKQEELLLLEESEEWVEQKLLITTQSQQQIEIIVNSIELEQNVATTQEPLPVGEAPSQTMAKPATVKQRTSPRTKAKAAPRKVLKRGGVAAAQKQKTIVVEQTDTTMLVDTAASSEGVSVEQSTTTSTVVTTTVAVVDNAEVENNENVEIKALTSSPVVENEQPISSPVRVIECKLNAINMSKVDQIDEAGEKMEIKNETIADQVPTESEQMQQEEAVVEAVTPDDAVKKRHTDSTNEDVLDLDYSQTEGDIDDMEEKSALEDLQKLKDDKTTSPSGPSDISESPTVGDDFYKSSPEVHLQYAPHHPADGGPHRTYGHPYYQHQHHPDGGFMPGQHPAYGHVTGVRPLGSMPYGQEFRPNYRGPYSGGVAPPGTHNFGPQNRPGFRPDYQPRFRPNMMRPMRRDGPPQRFMERGNFDPRMRMPGNGVNAGYRPPSGPHYQPNLMGPGGPLMGIRPMQPLPPPPGVHVPPGVNQPPGMNMPGGPAVLPRKVLINPNFKGGVEAATNQLMKDTMSSQQQFLQTLAATSSGRVLSDEELRRQTEEFINKNLAHVGKRRYERSPSPGRHRSPRSRSRSYSPRRRAYSREREFGPGSDGRGRTAHRGRAPFRHGRDPDDAAFPKRRRSMEHPHDSSNNKSPDENEDEETRAYRLKIESQKAEREKILREKERRRKEVAEERLKDIQKAEELAQAQKLTPIVVTEKKIISLKKRQQPVENSSDSETAAAHHSDKPTHPKSIPTAKVLPEAKREERKATSTAVVKPVVSNNMKKLNPHNLTDEELQLEQELLLEEEQLDDDPRATLTPPPPAAKHEQTVFPNRRVIIKPSSTTTDKGLTKKSPAKKQITSLHAVATTKSKAGIFDRLDRKKIGSMNDADKRKIQRIVINNTKDD